MRITESETRYSLIDPQLKRAGWNVLDHAQVGAEIPVEGYDKTFVGGYTDYCLRREDGDVLAVVEAKRTSKDARVGKEQALQYVKAIEKKQSFRPFAFLANGEDVFFIDNDTEAERHVAGFFSREDLNRILFLKENRKPFNSVKINESIVDRGYQAEAIRRIAESIEKKKKRKALLVMATGTGKTRTIMALIDVFLRTHMAQKVLFLADRDTLVEQAETDGFKRHIPGELRTRIWSDAIDEARRARICVSTIQTMAICHEKFSPAEFDLIVTDECHRSIYNKFTDVLAYFDGIQIGLTATPANLVDRDTFKFFQCEHNIPTFNYPYSQAVEEKHLVDYDGYAAQTKFQRKGVKGIDLTENEKESLRQRGIEPDELNFEGTDLERKVTNKDTLKRQWEEFMDVCLKDASGQLPGKSIVFAVTHDHAMRLGEAFSDMYPEYGGKLVQVITSKMERTRSLIDKFKKESLPRIAISVDMLDTGFDLPEAVNLAFMKPVNSQIKFWQMLGRGTRNHQACRHFDWLPNGKKERFLIVDFWENLEHFNMMKPDDERAGQVPVLVTIFNTRLKKLGHFLENQSSPDAERIKADLRGMIARIPKSSFSVQKVWKEVKNAWDADFWRHVSDRDIEFLRLKVGPLLRFVGEIRPEVEFFTSKVERCGLMLLEKKDSKAVIESIREDVGLLQTNIAQVAAQRKHVDNVLGGEFWKSVTLFGLDEVRDALSPLMKYRRERPSIMIELGLDDVIEANSRKWVIVRKGSEKVYVEEYRKRVEERIRNLAETHPTIKKIREKVEVGVEDLARLEETLETELRTDELSLDMENMLKAFGVRVGSLVDFLKHVLGLEELPTYEDVVRKAFDAYILEHNYNADQSRFLRAVQNVFMQTKKLEETDLYEEPFNRFGVNAVERLFEKGEIDQLVQFAQSLAA